jgi:hypothetical protein
MVVGFLLIKDSDFVNNSPVLSRFASLNTAELKTQGRYFVWPMAIEGWKERPILGWGQENFTYIFQEHYRPEMYELEPWFDRAHNIFLDWLVVGGLVGITSYLSLYLVLLYLLWWKSESLSHAEKSIITGLLAAYFFHNIFVFDHLISYILFFSLLAYVHSLVRMDLPVADDTVTPRSFKFALPVVLVLLIVSIYFGNIKPLGTNITLINALQAVQVSRDMSSAVSSLQDAYNGSHLGKYEVVEQIAANTPLIVTSEISIEAKNNFFIFAKDAITSQSNNRSIAEDARYQLLTGSFLSTTGFMDESLVRFERARELMPNKQQIYFEIGAAYINNNQDDLALEAFRQAYMLEPRFLEAKIIYLVGAIYAGDRELENELITELTESERTFDDRIINAYYSNNRISQAIAILQNRIKLDPANKETYQGYINCKIYRAMI